jgi:mannosyltransferase OCH1-like enzyme
MIPKTIHITIKDTPNQIQGFIINKWKTLHPDFEIRVYTDKDNDDFLNTYYPLYKPIYDRIGKNICKIDFIRLLYLYKFGGIYVDSDVLPLKDLTPLLDINELLLFKENDKNNMNFGLDQIISNAIIFSKPNNDFIKSLIDQIVSNVENIGVQIQNTDILNLTGPFLFNNVYLKYQRKNEITLFDGKYFNPLTFYDLKNNHLTEDIKYSFGVHLFEGSWWQNEYKLSLDLIERILNYHYDLIQLQPFPLISCLCITKNETALVNKSIECFKKQIYPNKELIVVYEEGNQYIDEIKQSNQDSNIQYHEVSSEIKKTLGELRNISINLSNGEYISQWDDDDWHNPLRLIEQFYYMKKYNKNGSILRTWLVYDERNNKLYSRERTDLIGWEGSVLFKKDSIQHFYESLHRGEDTGFVQKIENEIQPINYPELYIYRVHYNNTWDYRKLKIDIIDPGVIYKDQSLILNLFTKNREIKKVLCFTTSYNRLKMLRSCISDIKNQTCKNVYHSINITNDNRNEHLSLKIFDDIIDEKNFIVFNQNQNQHINHMLAITSVPNFEEYDIFVKIDDDDIYKKNYIKNIVDYFEKTNADVISSKATLQLNGSLPRVVEQHSLGGNPEGCDFKIPATFAFNKKALDLILQINTNYGFEDNMWRDVWCGQCIIGEVDNSNEYIWYIHGSNISTKDFLIE